MSEPEAYVEEKLSGPQVLGGGRRRKSRGKKSRGRKSRRRTRGGANHLVGAPITGGYKRKKTKGRRRH